LLACLLLAGNIAAAHGLKLGFAGILWSISVEEQFYLCWPLLIRVLNRRNVLAIGAFLWAASEAATVIQIHMGIPYYPNLWFSSLVHFQFLALGIMLAALARSLTLPAFAHVFIIVMGLCLLFFATSQGNLYLLFPLVSLGSVCIFVGVLGFKALESRPLGYLGRISYGLYVFHGGCLFLAHFIAHRIPFFQVHPYLLVATLPLPLAILVSSISYRYFETPFLKLKSRFEVVKTRPI
jgi:peptidoglycan/LPS O-acetylase OafA/YrhL